jgi:hypothetical protein
MNKDKIKVNNHTYLVALNEQTQMYARKLRGLYQQGYSDVDSFDEVSSEISTTVNNLLKRSVTPEVREEDMDGVIQHLLKAVDKARKNLPSKLGRFIQPPLNRGISMAELAYLNTTFFDTGIIQQINNTHLHECKTFNSALIRPQLQKLNSNCCR